MTGKSCLEDSTGLDLPNVAICKRPLQNFFRSKRQDPPRLFWPSDLTLKRGEVTQNQDISPLTPVLL